ncbi:ubiquitin carboxyl-terminal hydrolase 47-like [Epinephelus moara]|uniref:ubiquitin carboxyl-terminal hydrolase 47-like n=1 Tax=Epinephelus moara TaxID=300413 RepID=UPI00214EDFA6|nr:ubiquitin carboxyl-terminal hydrolase 47-like [Epinephelus moara]
MASSRRRSQDEVTEAERKKRKVRQPQGGHYGLYNQGATCYLNSVLQVLFMTPEIHDRLNPKSQVTVEELRNLFKRLKETTSGTENITKSLKIKNVCQQRDAAECLEMILQKVSPQASEVFKGQLRYTTKCTEGHSIIEETNPFWTLPLSLKDTHDDTTYSVGEGFERIFQQKSFSGDNMVYCNECEKKTEATTGCEMVTYPQILTLLLKRFDFDYSTMSDVKSNCRVDVPRTLQRKDKEYKLYGMVNHIGSLRGGHYTATILCSEDKTWYEFNDDHVSQVKQQPFAETSTYNSMTAYLLMYRATECQSPSETKSEDLTDEVKEQQGEDTLKEQQGEDTLKEQQGEDTLKEQQGEDTLKEQQGDDTLKEQQGGDTLKERQGEDTLKEQQGEDTKEQQGEDTLKEQQGGDTLKEQQGEDTLKEQQGEDTLEEQQGEDTLKEQQGEDTLKEQQGEDTLKEQQGEDTLKEQTEDQVEDTIKDEGEQMQHSEEDAAPAAPKRGPLEMLAAWFGNLQKSSGTDDAAEQDKTDAAPAAPKRGPLEMLAAWFGNLQKSSGTDDAAEQDKTATERQKPDETNSGDLTGEVEEDVMITSHMITYV